MRAKPFFYDKYSQRKTQKCLKCKDFLNSYGNTYLWNVLKKYKIKFSFYKFLTWFDLDQKMFGFFFAAFWTDAFNVIHSNLSDT